MSQTIEIIIAPDGTTRLETKGFLGADCRDASRFIEQALGKASREQLKSEFYQTDVETEPIRQQV